MVGQSVRASETPVLHDQIGTRSFRKSAEIVDHPRKNFPSREAYLKAFSLLVRATFNGQSTWQICVNAARDTGHGDPDTWDRMVNERTQKPDGYLVDLVKSFARYRGVTIPPELAVCQ